MAVGDLIQGRLTGVATFQPAAGVEITILLVDNDTGAQNVSVTDGANTSVGKAVSAMLSCNIPITNTIYLKSTVAVSSLWYCGVQTK